MLVKRKWSLPAREYTRAQLQNIFYLSEGYKNHKYQAVRVEDDYKMEKVDHQVSGYQLAYTAAKRQGAKIRYADITEIKDRNKASKTMRITSTCVRYRVWIRAYKKTGGKTCYSEWSDSVEAWRE